MVIVIVIALWVFVGFHLLLFVILRDPKPRFIRRRGSLMTVSLGGEIRIYNLTPTGWVTYPQNESVNSILADWLDEQNQRFK